MKIFFFFFLAIYGFFTLSLLFSLSLQKGRSSRNRFLWWYGQGGGVIWVWATSGQFRDLAGGLWGATPRHCQKILRSGIQDRGPGSWKCLHLIWHWGFWDGSAVATAKLLWLFPSIHHSSHNSVSPAWGWGRHLDSNSSKTVHGSGERGTWEAGGKGERCWVPRTKNP